jgi:L-lactate dehydrogenase complex protein LldG
MSARDDILGAIRKRRTNSAPRPAPYSPTVKFEDRLQRFAAMAQGAAAEVRVLENAGEIAQAVADVLRARNLPAEIHIPAGAAIESADWRLAPGLSLSSTPPGPDEAAITGAPFGIAETGTLAYPSSTNEPASWHFRPGLEIAVIRADDILPHMENVLARTKTSGLPSTLNFVTGPSRTGDIEQTLELGAHGPKALVILIVKG